MDKTVKVVLNRNHHDEEIEFTRKENGSFAISLDTYSGDSAYIYGITVDEMVRIREAIDSVLRG